MPSRLRNVLLAALAAAALAAALAAAWRLHAFYAPDQAMPARGGERFDLVLRVPDLKQHDPRWADLPIGGSQEPLRDVGCTLCSSAMLFAYHGIPLLPDQLNQRLQEVDGFTGEGRLKWESLVELSGGRLRLDYVGSPTYALIDGCLRDHIPVLAKTVKSDTGHWVVIVGKRDDDYLVNDPLARLCEPVALSALSNEISSIRVLR